MSKISEKPADTDLYARIEQTRMTAREREAAINSLRNAEAIVDGFMRVADGVRHLIARVFEKPTGLKHSH